MRRSVWRAAPSETDNSSGLLLLVYHLLRSAPSQVCSSSGLLLLGSAPPSVCSSPGLLLLRSAPPQVCSSSGQLLLGSSPPQVCSSSGRLLLRSALSLLALQVESSGRLLKSGQILQLFTFHLFFSLQRAAEVTGPRAKTTRVFEGLRSLI